MGNRLVGLDKFAVAVVHHDDAVRGLLFGNGCNPLNVLHKQGRPQAVAPGALDIHHFDTRVDFPLHGVIIGGSVFTQVDLPVFDAELLQRTVAVSGQTDDAPQGIIGHSGHAEHHVAGTEHAEQGHGQGMGTADKVVTHQRILRAQRRGIHLIQGVPAPVAVAIAGGGNKVAFADAGFNKGGQHFLLVIVLHFLNPGHGGGDVLHGLLCRPADGVVYVKIGMVFHVRFCSFLGC